MVPATKKEALQKVHAIEVGAKLRYSQQLAKIGKPLDKREWCRFRQCRQVAQLVEVATPDLLV